jgi:hypothetical protein
MHSKPSDLEIEKLIELLSCDIAWTIPARYRALSPATIQDVRERWDWMSGADSSSLTEKVVEDVQQSSWTRSSIRRGPRVRGIRIIRCGFMMVGGIASAMVKRSRHSARFARYCRRCRRSHHWCEGRLCGGGRELSELPVKPIVKQPCCVDYDSVNSDGERSSGDTDSRAIKASRPASLQKMKAMRGRPAPPKNNANPTSACNAEELRSQ